MAAKTVRIILEIDDRGNAKLVQSANKVANAAEAANKRAAASYRKFSRQVGSTLNGLFKKIVRWGVLIGSALVIGGIAKMIKIGAQFEQAMQDMKAVLKPTSNAFADLSDKARELGRTTVFSAKEAATGMKNLALAGFKATEILETIGPALDLAAAGGLDMAEAARITANVIRSMGLETKNFVEAANALTFAAINSNQTISDMGHAFKFIGPVANAINADITELSAALGVLANVGLRGEMAGTGLRRSMTVFLSEIPDGTDKIGKLNLGLDESAAKNFSLADAIEKMVEKAITATQVMKAFGQRAGPSMLALMQIGAEGIRRFQREIIELNISQRNLASEIAEMRLDTVAGDFRILGSEASEVAIAFFEKLSPAIRDAIQAMGTVLVGTDGKGGLAAWIKTKDIIQIVTDSFAALKTAVKALIVIRLALWIGSAIAAFNVMTISAGSAAAAVGAFATAANLIPFVAIITALGFIAVKLLKIKENANAAEGSLAWMTDRRFDALADGFLAGLMALKEYKEELKELGATDIDFDAITGIEDFSKVRRELGLVQGDILDVKRRMEDLSAGGGAGTSAMRFLQKDLEGFIEKEKELNATFTKGVKIFEDYTEATRLLNKTLRISADLFETYAKEWEEFKAKDTFVGPMQELERVNHELDQAKEFLDQVAENAKEASDANRELTKEQNKMISSLKKGLIEAGIGYETLGIETTNYLDALVLLAKEKGIEVDRAAVLEVEAEKFVKLINAARAYGRTLEELGAVDDFEVAVNFIVEEQDIKTPGFLIAFEDAMAEIKLDPTIDGSKEVAEAWKLAVQFLKDVKIGVELVSEETKRLKAVALEVNEAFTNVIDVKQFEGAAEIISKNFTQKMIDNMDPETYAALFSEAVQQHFDSQPVGLITPDMYAPQLAELEEKFRIAMKNNELSSDEFAQAYAEDIQFIVGMMDAAGVEISDKWAGMFEFLRINELRLYREEQLDQDLKNMELFAEAWRERWGQLVQTQVESMLAMGLQAISTGESLSKAFTKWKDQAIKQFTQLIAKWIVERIKLFILEKATSKAVTGGQFSSELAIVYANTFASIAAIPWIGPALAPAAAAAAVATVSSVGGAFLAAGFAEGGLVRGMGGPTDDAIMARLSAGEFVIKAAAVENLGVGFLNTLNQNPQGAVDVAAVSVGAAGRFAEGGLVQSSPGAGFLDTLSQNPQGAFAGGAGSLSPAPVGGSVTRIVQVVIHQSFTGDNWSENGISDELREVVITGAREAIEEGTELEFPTEVQ